MLNTVSSRKKGTLRLNLVCARELIAADKNGKSDPYAIFHLSSNPKKKVKSKTIKKTLNPDFNESFYLQVTDPKAMLRLQMMDHDVLTKDDKLGTAEVSLSGLRRAVETQFNLTLQGVKSGQVTITLNALDFDAGGAASGNRSVGKLRLTALRCRNLVPSDLGGKADPFVTFRIKDKSRPLRTSIKKKCLDPMYDESFDFDIDDPHGDVVQIQVYDYDKWTRNDFMGQATLPLLAVTQLDRNFEDWLPLCDKGETSVTASRKERGDILVRAQWFGPDNPQSSVRSDSRNPPNSTSTRSLSSTREQPSSSDDLQQHWVINFKDVKLGEELGKGEFGIVYKGSWRMQAVAVKRLKVQNMEANKLADFRREAALMMNLRPHKNIVQLLGVCVDPQQPLAIVTAFVGGGSLHSYLRVPASPLSWATIMNLLKGICAGMYHMHEEGVLHRDLAARNVLLAPALGSSYENPNFTALLSDFGLSKALEELNFPDESMSNSTQVEQFRGPFKYMAPESLRSLASSPIDFSVKSDVWSFAVVIWEILTRSEPHSEIGLFEAAHRIAHENLRLVLPPNVPIQMRALMNSCWRDDPADRPTFATIAEMLSAVEEELAAAATSSTLNTNHTMAQSAASDMPVVYTQRTSGSAHVPQSFSERRRPNEHMAHSAALPESSYSQRLSGTMPHSYSTMGSTTMAASVRQNARPTNNAQSAPNRRHTTLPASLSRQNLLATAGSPNTTNTTTTSFSPGHSPRGGTLVAPPSLGTPPFPHQ